MREREIGQYRWGKMCVGGFGFKFREIRSDDGVREREGGTKPYAFLSLYYWRERETERGTVPSMRCRGKVGVCDVSLCVCTRVRMTSFEVRWERKTQLVRVNFIYIYIYFIQSHNRLE